MLLCYRAVRKNELGAIANTITMTRPAFPILCTHTDSHFIGACQDSPSQSPLARIKKLMKAPLPRIFGSVSSLKAPSCFKKMIASLNRTPPPFNDPLNHKAVKPLRSQLTQTDSVQCDTDSTSVSLRADKTQIERELLRVEIEKLRERPNCKLTLAGHGNWIPDYGYVKIPANTTLRFATQPGVCLNNSVARILDEGDSGPLHNSTGKLYIFGPGQWVANLKLAPIRPSMIAGNPLTVDHNTHLDELLYKLQGLNLDWSACFLDPRLQKHEYVCASIKKSETNENMQYFYHIRHGKTPQDASRIIDANELRQSVTKPIESPGLVTQLGRSLPESSD